MICPLNLLDVAAALTIIFSIKTVAFYFFVMLFIKALYSIFSAMAFSSPILFFLGFIDLLASIALYFVHVGSIPALNFMIGIALLSKGIYFILKS